MLSMTREATIEIVHQALYIATRNQKLLGTCRHPTLYKILASFTVQSGDTLTGLPSTNGSPPANSQ